MDHPVSGQQPIEQSHIKQSRKTAFQPNLKKRVILIILVVLISGNFAYNRSQVTPNLLLEDLPLLSLSGIHRYTCHRPPS